METITHIVCTRILKFLYSYPPPVHIYIHMYMFVHDTYNGKMVLDFSFCSY